MSRPVPAEGLPQGAAGAISARLAGEVDAVADEIACRILREVPAYARLGDDGAPSEDFRDDVRALVGALVSVLADDRPVSEAERAAVAGLAESRARQGVGVDDMYRAFHVGEIVGRDRLFHAWSALPSAERTPGTFERMSASLADAVYELRRAVRAGFDCVEEERVDERQGVRKALVGRLFEAGPDDPGSFLAQARALGLDLTPPLAVVVVAERIDTSDPMDPTPAGADWERRVHECARALPPPRPAVELVDPEPTYPRFGVLLVPDANPARLAETRGLLEAACERLGLAGAHALAPTLASVAPAFRRLRAPIPVLGRMPERLGALATPEALMDLRLAASLHPDEQDAALRHALGGIMLDVRMAAEHYRSLVVLDAMGWDVNAAAPLLHLSPGGLRERMRRMEKLSGLSLFAHRFLVVLALRVGELRGHRLKPPGHPWWSGVEDEGDEG